MRKTFNNRNYLKKFAKSDIEHPANIILDTDRKIEK